MSQVWYKDESHCSPDDCHFDPPRYLTVEELKACTDIEIYKIDADNFENDVAYQRIKKERGYNYEDLLEMCVETMTDEEKHKAFSAEHLHEDEEIRLFLKGCGCFDIRDPEDNWIRIQVTKGDLLILPAGIYHRFYIGKENYVKIRRLFSEFPCWIGKYRPEADSNTTRQKYLENFFLKQDA